MGGLGASGLVFVGAGLGAVCRYWVGAVVGGRSFPWATLGVNVLGGLIIGLIISALPATSGARAFWVVGVLGGFTTFSAFSAEALEKQQIVNPSALQQTLPNVTFTSPT